MEMKYLLIRDTFIRGDRLKIELSNSVVPSLFITWVSLSRDVCLSRGINTFRFSFFSFLSSRTGIATQTILTIPVSHVTNNQMVNLALSNGQVVSTTLANLQSIAQPQNMLNTPTSNGEFTGINKFIFTFRQGFYGTAIFPEKF